MEEEKNIGVGSFNIIESLYQPIKDQEKLFGDRKYNFDFDLKFKQTFY